MTAPVREYAPLIARLGPRATRLDSMRLVCDVLWDAFSARGLSWIGFYEKAPGDEMILVVRRDKPACSPIGLHGMCGKGWRDRAPIIITDVATLGSSYIACDPRDRSEAVVPCLNADGTCWGVLDADSHDVGAFGHADIAGMRRMLETCGLSVGPMGPTIEL